ncbi:metal-dependent phosphohydrolase HD region [Methylobacterium sp. 4-46]|uniref:HD domain-containing protein n=1 Tax=unclassified Methylobacterium TaxID=2615210 RepID=UPI000165C576|nr:MULTISPECIES: HD domain-containing protein [Methylobacterium]ACA14881.1 metal-dependent phosphohydrolase HD region [Methylobacterium sp. 4-46]WFT80621.1 HD domain-containing protein [Methylobacterium nodulans]
MITTAHLAAEALGDHLAAALRGTFGATQAPLAEMVGSVARLALECLANSDALYHDLEHTLLVTQVGLDILRGRTLLEPVTAGDWAHLLVACLMHDIGYVRGILPGDSAREGYVVDAAGGRVVLPRGASDAALTAHHVERSKLFVSARLGQSDLLDAARIARSIEHTRFPAEETCPGRDPADEACLVRAADLIGQMGDPLYLRKANALFHEFEEAGTNAALGYTSPADLVERYPDFFWRSVSSHLDGALKYLDVTVSGRQWIAGLQANVFRAERPGGFGPPRAAP